MSRPATRVKPAQQAQPGRHDAPARKPGEPGSRGTEFDVQRWFEHYLAVNGGSDATDPLAGVPFN